MAANSKTINSNVTGVSVAEEAEVGHLPGENGNAGSPAWYDRSVTSYSDFGANTTFVADDSINPSRQNQRGVAVGVEAAGGVNMLMTNDRTRDMQGFFFADAHELTDTAPLNGTAVTLTSTNGTGGYIASGGGLSIFPDGALVLASGFALAANNIVSEVTGTTSTTLTTDGATVVEAVPPADARVQQVGIAFGSGDLSLAVAGGLATLSSTAGGFADIDLQVGQWIFIGGDASGEQFAAGYGYARVYSKDDDDVVLDDVAWVGTLATDSGAGKTVHVYGCTFIRNEKDKDLIKCRTYNVERTLGEDDDGTQAEYLVGAAANELTINIPLKERHTLDMSWVALNNTLRSGLEGVKSGDHTAAVKQSLYNTSSDVFRLAMPILDSATLAPTGMFAFASDATFTINNNVTATEAIGEFGGIGITVGNFVGGGAITAYFTTVAQVKAINDNSDVGFNAIMAQGNKGIVYDMPLLGVGGGGLTVEKDTAIQIPIEIFGAENDAGYTMSYCSFDYLPNVAMPAK